jgi:pimeloyl-ACP methyl ester carboxylesterase
MTTPIEPSPCRMAAAAVMAILLVGNSAASSAEIQTSKPSQNSSIRLAQSSRPTEETLRKLIGSLQQGSVDPGSLESAVSAAVTAQSQVTAALLARLGPLQQIEFLEPQNGLDSYKVSFQNGATIWLIQLSAAGKVSALSFRPFVPMETAGEEVSIAGLSGTLLKPQSVERPPVVLIIAGSGPTDRNGNQYGTGPGELRQLAEHLATKGIASLRYDKRGIGRSSGANLREEELSLDSFVEDAGVWLRLLQQRTDLGPAFVAGHSEGGLFAIALAKRLPFSGLVLLATPGRRLGDVLREQLSTRLPPPLRAEAMRILTALERGETVMSINEALQPLFRPGVQPLMRSMLAIDPAADLASLRLPVMIVSGGHDIQVSAEDARRLADAKPDATRLDIAEMNHVLKIAPADPAAQQDAYSNPALSLAPGLGDSVASFIIRNTPPGGRDR